MKKNDIKTWKISQQRIIEYFYVESKIECIRPWVKIEAFSYSLENILFVYFGSINSIYDGQLHFK